MTEFSFSPYGKLIELLGKRASRFDIHLLAECDSTNAVLLARAEDGAPSGTVVIARHQTAGRGRRGRRWISAPGDSLTFSLLWRFPSRRSPAGLSLAVGVAIARAVKTLIAEDSGSAAHEHSVQLKWPNDILLGGKKLGGILVELVPGLTGAAVLGIGINLRLPEAMPPEVRLASAALAIDDAGERLLALALAELPPVLDEFESHGFVSMRDGWSAFHAHANLPVRLLSDFAPAREGICRGVDDDGALLLEVDSQIERILSGEVSLRSAI